MEELECDQGSGAEQRVLVRECVAVLRLLARGDLMIIFALEGSLLGQIFVLKVSSFREATISPLFLDRNTRLFNHTVTSSIGN